MQKEYYVFRITVIVAFLIYLNSCSSSSYYERYGGYAEKSSQSSKRKAGKSAKQIVSVEDEIKAAPSNVSKTEANSIIDKLSHITDTNRKKERFLNEIVSYLHTPYRYGGESRKGIDCSAFTQKVYKSLDVNIPRTAREQYRTWEIFKNKSKLKFGDLIYFNTSRKYFPGHVGIYLDDDLFAHASSSQGVIVSSLENKYYSNKFVGANRVKIKN